MNVQEGKRVLAYMGAVWQADLTDEALAVWAETLHPLAFASAYDAAQRLKETKTWFPSHAEFLQAYQELHAAQARKTAAIQAAQNHPRDGMVACTNCSDTGVEWHEPRAAGYSQTVLPCHVCRPDDHRDLSEGHHLPSHAVASCEWPRCKRRNDDAARRRAMGNAFAQAPGTRQMVLVDNVGEF